MPTKPSMRILALILIFLAIANIVFGPWPRWGSLLTFGIIALFGQILGRLLFPDWHKIERLATGIALILAWIAILGGLFLFFDRLDRAAIGVIVLTFGALLLIPRPTPALPPLTLPLQAGGDREGVKPIELGLVGKDALRRAGATIAYLILLALLYRLITHSGTTESIRTPWEVLPASFFPLLFLTTIGLIALFRKTAPRISFVAGLALMFLVFAVTIFVYPIGFGFDPYVHVATESHIANYGTITPKPFSYLGQYALVTFFHHTTGAPVVFLDRLLLPFILIFFTFFALRRGIQDGLGLPRQQAGLAALLLPIIPFSQWIVTTPQGLGNVFVLLTVSLALYKQFKPSLATGLVSFAALATHPLAGIPAVTLFVFTLVRAITKWLPRIVRWLVWPIAVFISAVLLPLLFTLYGQLTGTDLVRSPNWNSLIDAATSILPTFENRWVFIYDFVHSYGRIVVPIIIIVALIVWFSLRKQKRGLGLLLITSLATTVNAALLIIFIDFSYLPLAEQSGYAERLAGVGLLFLVPLVLFAFVRLLGQTNRLNLILRLGVIAFVAAVFTTSVYLSYPHNDPYRLEHGWGVGAADLEAVRFINQDGNDVPYIVLSNQSVAAAALREFGFKKYYKFSPPSLTDEQEGYKFSPPSLKVEGEGVDIFYYSIPTGGPLYKYFNDASYGAPIRQTIEAAMASVSVQRTYFVVNQYWFRSSKLIERAKLEADSWWSFGNNRVHVFRFDSTN